MGDGEKKFSLSALGNEDKESNQSLPWSMTTKNPTKVYQEYCGQKIQQYHADKKNALLNG